MKKIFLLISICLLFSCNEQNKSTLQQVNKVENTEVDYSDLLYSKNTIKKLTYIVDSINSQTPNFKNKNFKSLIHTKGIYFEIKDINFEKVIKSFKSEKDFDSIVKQFPSSRIKKNKSLILLTQEPNNLKFYNDIQLNKTSSNRIFVRGKLSENQFQNNKYLFEDNFDTAVRYNHDNTIDTLRHERRLKGFYFNSPISSTSISGKPSKLIQYVDFMIDTLSTQYSKNAKIGNIEYPKKLDSLNIFEKKELLTKCRETYIRGYCSQDSGPIIHETIIAKLAGETYNWNIFLRSHLNILNDYFSRMSDNRGAKRKTYIKELELMNINVVKLLLGTALSVKNVNENHFFGDIHRIGMAFSEYSNKDYFEKELIRLVNSPKLDSYNKYKLIWLFETYNNCLSNPKRKELNKQKLKVLKEKHSA